MDLSAYDNLSHEEQREFVSFLLWHYRVVDAFWFLRVEEDYGLNKAEDINARVWGKVSELAARELKKRFDMPEQGGLEGFARVLSLYPWTMIAAYPIECGKDELRIRVSKCPPQEGRKKHGLGEYACKAMHMAEFKSIAGIIDPRIRVECEFAPPDPHPEDCYCSWRIFMEDDES